MAGDLEHHGIRRLTAWLLVVITGVATACDDHEEERADEQIPEVLRVADVEVETSGEDEQWSPDAERVDDWFNRALQESDLGLSADEGDVEMKVHLHHRTHLQEASEDQRMAVHVDARAVRRVVGNGEPMISLEAEATEASLIGEQHPSVLRLHHENEQVGREAVGRAVDKLRLRARLEGGGTERLLAWIEDETADTDKRVIAIDWAVDRQLEGAVVRPALVEALQADDPEIVGRACRALVELEVEGAAHLVVDRAQQLSRQDQYEAYLEVVPVLGELDERWISIYLQTVARAHDDPRVRQKARSTLDDPLQF